MNVTTVKLNGKEYVVVPKRRNEQLTRAEQDKKDAQLARKVWGVWPEVRYRVVISAVANRAAARLDKTTRRRIADRLAALAENPRPAGCIELTGVEAYRIRVGDYRIVQELADRVLIVTVVDVGHRREVYRGM